MDAQKVSDRGTLKRPSKVREARYRIYGDSKVRRLISATVVDPVVAATLRKKAQSRNRAA